MSKLSKKSVGKTKRIVGEVLGEGKLVEEARQSAKAIVINPDKDGGARRGPVGINDLTTI